MTTTIKKKNGKDFKIISLRKLATASKLDYPLIYNNFRGRYDSLDANQKTQLANAAFEEMEAFFDFLGFELKLKRKD